MTRPGVTCGQGLTIQERAQLAHNMKLCKSSPRHDCHLPYIQFGRLFCSVFIDEAIWRQSGGGKTLKSQQQEGVFGVFCSNGILLGGLQCWKVYLCSGNFLHLCFSCMSSKSVLESWEVSGEDFKDEWRLQGKGRIVLSCSITEKL